MRRPLRLAAVLLVAVAACRARFHSLETDPRLVWCKRLVNIRPPAWRFRVEKFRLLYEVDDATRTVTVREVKRRDGAY